MGNSMHSHKQIATLFAGASRIIEGSAFAMVSIAGVVFINAWFPEKQGLFNGLYTTFGAIGSALALNTVLPISQATGLVGVWWVTSAVIALFAVLFFLVVKEVEQTAPIGAGDQASSDGGIASVLKLKSLVAIGVAQLLCGFVLYFYINNYPTVFVNVYAVAWAACSESRSASLAGSCWTSLVRSALPFSWLYALLAWLPFAQARRSFPTLRDRTLPMRFFLLCSAEF